MGSKWPFPYLYAILSAVNFNFDRLGPFSILTFLTFFTGKGGGPLRVGEGGPLRVGEGGPLRVGEGGLLRVGEGVPHEKLRIAPFPIYLWFSAHFGVGADFDHIESLTILRVGEGVPYS